MTWIENFRYILWCLECMMLLRCIQVYAYNYTLIACYAYLLILALRINWDHLHGLRFSYLANSIHFFLVKVFDGVVKVLIKYLNLSHFYQFKLLKLQKQIFAHLNWSTCHLQDKKTTTGAALAWGRCGVSDG